MTSFFVIATLVATLVVLALVVRLRTEFASLTSQLVVAKERGAKNDAILEKLERRTRQMQMENYRIRKKLGVEQEWLKEWGLESEIEFLQAELDHLRAEKIS